MTNRPALLRQIYTEARPYVEQLVELNVAFTGFRKLATDNGLDWGQIKALLRAEIEDGEDGGSEKVDRIIQKAEYASEYAALLGLGTSNMNERNSISAGLPPHDEDGVIIEPDTRRQAAGVTASPEECGTRTHHAGSTDGGDHEVAPAADSDTSIDKADFRFEAPDDMSRRASGAVSIPQSGAPLTPDAPGSSPGPVPVETPGAPLSGEMPDLPDFLRRVA